MSNLLDDRFGMEAEASKSRSPSGRRVLVALLAILPLICASATVYASLRWVEAERRASALARACPLAITVESVVSKIGPFEWELGPNQTYVKGSFKGEPFRAWQDGAEWLQEVPDGHLCVQEIIRGRRADPELVEFIEAYQATRR